MNNQILIFNPKSANAKHRIPNSILQVGASIYGVYEFVFVDGKVVKRNVELGISNDRLQEITSGLAVDDKVVIGPERALSKLKEGDSVKEIEKKAE